MRFEGICPPFKNIEFFLTDQDMDIIQLPEINDNATFLRNAQEMPTTGLCVLDLLLVRGSELQIVGYIPTICASCER